MLGRTKPSPNSLKERLATISEDLINLHRDLYWLVEDNDAATQEQDLGDLRFDQIMALKLAVDNVRELLWKYVDAVAKVEPQRVQEAMETYRVRRVSKLLELPWATIPTSLRFHSSRKLLPPSRTCSPAAAARPPEEGRSG